MLLTDPIAWLCAGAIGYAVWQRSERKREQAETRDGVATLRRLLEKEPAVGASLPSVARALARETAALRPRSTLLELMLAESSAGLMVVSRDQTVLAVNTAALRILAAATLNAGDAATQRMSRLAPHPALIECVEQTFATNTARETEFEIRKASGRNAVAVATRLLRRDDAPYACMLTIVDVTQLRQLERMRQDFVANVSHELRTPITAIVGWVETMAGMELGPAEREVLETVDAQAGRLESLVNDLLMLVRTVAILSGMCTGLDPNFNLWGQLEPYARKLVAEETSSAFSLDNILEQLGGIVQVLVALPAQASRVLAQIERDAGDRTAAVEAATAAYRLAWCDGEPYAYHWGLVAARKHLVELGAAEPSMPPFDESKHEPMPEVEINPDDEFHVDK